MAVAGILHLVLELLKAGGAYRPIEEHIGDSFDEGTTYEVELASGGAAYTLPVVAGAGQGDIATVSLFYLKVDQTVTLTFNGAAISMVGTVTQPAIIVAMHISTTTAPTVTNASGNTANLVVMVAGT